MPAKSIYYKLRFNSLCLHCQKPSKVHFLMANQKMLVVLVMLMAACLPLNGAVNHLVGGERGWSMEVDYKAWAESQQFYVGDKLVFKYQKGDHNVIKVDEAGFRDCTPTSAAEVLDTGKDAVTLTTPGKKWYICGVPVHCSIANQKLEINVLSRAQSPESSSTSSDAQPPASSSGNRREFAGSHAVMVALSVLAIVAMV